MAVATAPAPPSRCDPARGDARPESRGASVSAVALGDAGSRGPGEVTGRARRLLRRRRMRGRRGGGSGGATGR